MSLTIRLTKISDTTHRLAVVRPDGSVEEAELPSRSFLIHDFIHYAVEWTAGLRQSFWGLLASGRTLAELGAAMQPEDGVTPDLLATEPATTELVVGCFTGLAHDRATPAEAIDGVRRLVEAQGRAPPDWLTLDFAIAVQARLRALRGEWKALPYRGTMELIF